MESLDNIIATQNPLHPRRQALQRLPEHPQLLVARRLSMAEACWATGVSKASINVRLSVQHKCHCVMLSLYQMMTQ